MNNREAINIKYRCCLQGDGDAGLLEQIFKIVMGRIYINMVEAHDEAMSILIGIKALNRESRFVEKYLPIAASHKTFVSPIILNQHLNIVALL